MKTEKSYNFFPKKGEEGRGSKSLNFSLFEGVPKKDIITITFIMIRGASTMSSFPPGYRRLNLK